MSIVPDGFHLPAPVEYDNFMAQRSLSTAEIKTPPRNPSSGNSPNFAANTAAVGTAVGTGAVFGLAFNPASVASTVASVSPPAFFAASVVGLPAVALLAGAALSKAGVSYKNAEENSQAQHGDLAKPAYPVALDQPKGTNRGFG